MGKELGEAEAFFAYSYLQKGDRRQSRKLVQSTREKRELAVRFALAIL
jgi:hypothetical protein